MRVRGVTLVELMLCLAVAAAVTILGMLYWKGIKEDAFRATAQTDMQRMRNAIRLYRAVRTETAVTSLAQVSEGRDPMDPWGQPYRLDLAKSRIVCLGPDGEPSDDDLFELFPPNPSDGYATPYVDVEAPRFTAVSPRGKVYSLCPKIIVVYFDEQSGVDWDTLTMSIDGKRVSEMTIDRQCMTTLYDPPHPLGKGTHSVEVTVCDRMGNRARRSWTFTCEADLPEGYTPPPEPTLPIELPGN